MVIKQLHCGSEALVHLCLQLLPCTDALCMHATASYYLCIHREALTEPGGIVRPVRGAIPYYISSSWRPSPRRACVCVCLRRRSEKAVKAGLET